MDVDTALSLCTFSHVRWEEGADGIITVATPFGQMEWSRESNLLSYGGKKVDVSQVTFDDDDEALFFALIVDGAIAAYRDHTAYAIVQRKRYIGLYPMEDAVHKGQILTTIEPNMVYLIPKYYDVPTYINKIDVHGNVVISGSDVITIRIPQGEIKYTPKKHLIEAPGLSVNTYKIRVVSPLSSCITFFAALVNAAFLAVHQGVPWYIVKNEEDGLLHPPQWCFGFCSSSESPFAVVYPR